jgi:hypothetical protein
MHGGGPDACRGAIADRENVVAAREMDGMKCSSTHHWQTGGGGDGSDG